MDLLRDSAAGKGVVVHAYVLMDNHFHLLLTPSVDGALSRCMQALGRSYVRHVNPVPWSRPGTCGGRPLPPRWCRPEAYLLPCMVCRDLNPVRHGLVLQPQDWPWSSHAHYAGLRVDRWLTPHGRMWRLGNTVRPGGPAYRAMVAQGRTAEQQAALTRSALGLGAGRRQFPSCSSRHCPAPDAGQRGPPRTG